jgi:hypothetical protein
MKQQDAEIVEMLRREKQLLCQAEKITEQMQTAPAEQLPSLTIHRGRFLEEAHRLHEQEQLACRKDALLRAALDNTAQPPELTPPLLAVYEAAMSVKAAIQRIRNNSGPAADRLAHEKGELQKKLDALNTDAAKTASRYARVVRTTGETPRLERERKI